MTVAAMRSRLSGARAGLVRSLGVGRPRRVPPIRQIEAVECGAVSLAMVLAHHGAWRPLEELRALCGVSRDGSNASNILKAARSLGLAGKGYRKEPAGLHDLPFPLIVHWNFNHYVVLEGLTDREAFVCDPALGPRRISLAEFDECYTGVALAFEPTPALVRNPRPPGLAHALAERSARSKAAVLLIACLSLAVVVPGVVLPFFAKVFVDGILVRQQEHWLVPLLSLFALVAVLQGAITLLRERAMLRLKQKLTAVGSAQFLWHLLRLPIGFFLQRSHGEIASRVEASRRVAQTISGDLPESAVDAFGALVFLLVLAAYDLAIGLTALALVVPSIVAVLVLQKRLDEGAAAQSVDLGKLGGATAGLIANIETTKAAGLENQVFSSWAGHHAKYLGAAQRVGLVALRATTVPAFFAYATEVAVLGVAVVKVMAGAITLGDLVAIQLVARSFSVPLVRVFQRMPVYREVAADLRRVDDALRNAPDPLVGTATPAQTTAVEGHVRLANVSFGYGPLDPPLLRDIELAIEPGQRVALVGASGCGKSTLGRIVCGLLRPSSGTVLVDGRPLETMGQADRAATIAYVDQDAILFEGTVRDNLTLWRPEVSDAVLLEALADAALLEEIAGREGALHARVDEGGRNFSGGQRHRLEIARALVGDPAILVLDEATAALDPETERRIDENLRRRGCTTIIIAHRLSTIRDSSEIVVLDAGRIVERGTHEDLLAADGLYAALVKSL